MRHMTTILALAGTLLGSAALAQSAVPGDLPAKTMVKAANTVSMEQTMVSDYIDQNVYGPGEQSIGEIKDLVFDASSGSVTLAIIGVGGFLGMGEKSVAIPFAQLKPVTKNGKTWLMVTSTKEELKAAPDFKRQAALNSKPMTPVVEPAMNAAAPAPATTAGALNSKPMTPVVEPGMNAAAPAPAVTADAGRNPPLPGANSFTEAQVRSRLEGMGYSAIGGLAKDDQSIWRGTATKDGTSVKVAVDYKGNVVAQ